MRTELDDTPEYKESVREAIVAFDPVEGDPEHGGIDEHVLDLASCYLWWNNYRTVPNDGASPLYCSSNDDSAPNSGTIEPAHFTYHVLLWTEGNT